MKTLILQVAIDTPLRQHFDYLPPLDMSLKHLQAGMRVKVPFRNKITIGVLLGTSNQSSFDPTKLKRAIEFLDDDALLPSSIMQLAVWAANYYQHGIGEVLLSCFPTLLRQDRSIKSNEIIEQAWATQDKCLDLNVAQQNAVQQINQSKSFQTFLLQGVTGSGKTEVYLRVIAEKLQAKQQALVLVPEISLTPQTLARFQQRFAAPIVVMHSNLTEKQRAQAWLQAQTGEAAIIIGTRSAIFTPLKNPGIIILDEEHDLSFKQQSGFRYSARDLAILRGQLENIPVLLGSATPSLESLYNVKRKRFQLLELPERAGTATHPSFHVIDIRNQYLEDGISTTLLQRMQQHLQREGQVLIFLNRRGFAPTWLCHHCGWIAKCKRCDAHLTLHEKPRRLFCHHCEAQQTVPTKCESCHSNNLLALGLGTERLEKTLQKHFPDTNLVRIDRDSTRRKGSLQKMLDDIQSGHSKILIGTQMLTKGHHFPDVTLVAIVDIDSGLFSGDFRASERLGQLITQVAGRAGRAEKPGEVFLQTHHPEHPLLMQLIQHGYANFAETLLQEREQTHLPPHTYLGLLRAEAVKQMGPHNFLELATAAAKKINSNAITLLGPIPAPLERKAGLFRSQLWIQAKQRKSLQLFLNAWIPMLEKIKTKPQVRWSLDVDPQEVF
jgi:primosomal protein N' (replication factor Y)